MTQTELNELRTKLSSPTAQRLLDHIDDLRITIQCLLAMPSACTTDPDIEENNKRRAEARALLE